MAKKKVVAEEVVELEEIVVDAPGVEEVVEETAEAEESEPAPNVVKVAAVVCPLYDPFQHVMIQEGIGVILERSSWVEAQLKAGILVEVK
jgi:hypothetical protein